MTVRRRRNVRHIPEEELHPYLDQALSRSQCIEIETHLAICSACRRERDAIAALRDRTTRLLGLAAPVRVRAPAWTELEGEAMARRRRRPWRRVGVWAASLVGAVLAGWGLKTSTVPYPNPLATLLEARAIFVVNPAPAPVQTVSVDPGREVARLDDDQGVRLISRRPVRPLTPVAPVTQPSLALPNDWSVVTLAEAAQASDGLVPQVAELPIVQVRMRPVPEGRPLMLVTQTDAGGNRVYTIEGPVSEVRDLLGGPFRSGGLQASDPSRSLPDYVEVHGRVQRSRRVLAVFGRLTADSLNALAAGVVLK